MIIPITNFDVRQPGEVGVQWKYVSAKKSDVLVVIGVGHRTIFMMRVGRRTSGCKCAKCAYGPPSLSNEWYQHLVSKLFACAV